MEHQSFLCHDNELACTISHTDTHTHLPMMIMAIGIVEMTIRHSMRQTERAGGRREG